MCAVLNPWVDPETDNDRIRRGVTFGMLFCIPIWVSLGIILYWLIKR